MLLTKNNTKSPDPMGVRVRLVGPGEKTGVTADLIPLGPYFRSEIELQRP